MSGGAGNDTIVGGTGESDSVDGGSGNDKITLASGSFSGVEGGDGSDKLTLGGAGWTLDAKSKSGSSLTGTGDN